MKDEKIETLVLIHVPAAQTPIAPHRPGTFVVGYLEGSQVDAHEYLNACKAEKSNVMVRNAFLIQIGIEFEPEFQRGPEGRPLPGPDGQPLRTGKVGINQGFALFPLSAMDAVNGCDYGVDPIYWVFPKGSMVQDLEAQMAAAADTLVHKRSGITTHPNLPQGIRPQGLA